ncbi:twin-arginine translocation signal domain-containing protein [Mongoliimonas terrestris]|uniref:twin-arginine translocation signal domain-containing protein n=1 Tax=Mongoliimonas terrestris TaxID=1709001 RepID=UPI0009497398|nr:twin-arginine translocation signal domain-containing protein [Mongoliimonas terrestris]
MRQDDPTKAPPTVDRRAFLTGAGLAGATAAAAVGGTVLAEARESPEEQLKGRYSETPHVQRFYALNRL